MRTIKPAVWSDIVQVQTAIELLRMAREKLVAAGAAKAAEKVRLALTSTGGALRHVKHRYNRTERQ